MHLKSIRDRMWSFGRETECAHIDGYTKRPDYRQLCYAVVDAVLAIRETGEILADHIESFSAAAECPFEFVFCNGGKRLIQAAWFSEQASERLRTLASHRQWRPRFNVMCLMSYDPPMTLGIELLSQGLQDSSAKVASRAAGACDELGGEEALLLLKRLLPIEGRAAVREDIAFTIELMETPPVRNGRKEERLVRGVIFSRDVGYRRGV